MCAGTRGWFMKGNILAHTVFVCFNVNPVNRDLTPFNVGGVDRTWEGGVCWPHVKLLEIPPSLCFYCNWDGSCCPGASVKSAYCGVPSGTVGRPAAGLMPSCGHLHLSWCTAQSPSISSALLDSVPGDTESHNTPVIWATCGCCRYQPVLHVAHVCCQSDLFFFLSCNSSIKSLVKPVQDKPK